MKEIRISTQKELDDLPSKFTEYTRVIIENTKIRIYIKIALGNASVEAWGNASVEAWDNASVVARGNASVVARGNASVVARGNASVVAWSNASVEAWDNASVVAWDNASVVARGNASVVARGNASVEAFDFSIVVLFYCLSVTLYKFSTCILRTKGYKKKIKKKDRSAIIVDRTQELNYTKKDFINLCKKEGDKIVLYKRVKENLTDFRTGTIKYEGTVTCPDFKSSSKIECGNGLHLSRTINEVKQYQSTGVFLKCLVHPDDLAVFPRNITKVRCKKVKVLHKVDERGNKLA